MTKRTVSIISGRLVACLASVLLVTDATRAQPPSFRAGVDLVSLSVTVTASREGYVADLDRNDFVVFENGVPQTVTHFAKGTIPLALALLIDTSASMEQALPTAQEAAVGFVRQLAPTDVATVIDFDNRVQTAQDFTSDARALEAAIRRTRAGGSTALYNALYIALKELGKLTSLDSPETPRRPAVIVLSDGADTSSLVAFDEILDLASRSDTMVYAIGLGTPHESGSRRDEDGPFVLRRLTQRTGGRAFFPREASDLPVIYKEIRDELASQYLLAYEATGARDGRWRPLAVRVTRRNVAVRTRQGYYAAKRR